MDPRVNASDADMTAWQREARKIERTECTLRRAQAELATLERQVEDLAAKGAPAERIAALRKELRPIVLALRGDPRDPGHVNLPGRINWLTIQVGNYSGVPTKAQMEWIETYAKEAANVARMIEAFKRRPDL
jgi:hypothetical protein